jgi:hypothetical protein
MCIKRWGAGVAVMNGCLWVIGGMNGAERGTVPTLEVYDPGLASLCFIPPVASPTRGVGSPLLCLLALTLTPFARMSPCFRRAQHSTSGIRSTHPRRLLVAPAPLLLLKCCLL